MVIPFFSRSHCSFLSPIKVFVFHMNFKLQGPIGLHLAMMLHLPPSAHNAPVMQATLFKIS